MSRHLVCLLAFFAATAFAYAESINVIVVSVDGDNLVMEGIPMAVNVTKQTPVTRVEIVNGVKRTTTVLVPVQTTETSNQTVKLKAYAFYDLDGLQIAPEKVPDLLKKPRAVVFSSTPKINKAVRDVLKDGTLIAVLDANYKPPDKPPEKPLLRKP